MTYVDTNERTGTLLEYWSGLHVFRIYSKNKEHVFIYIRRSIGASIIRDHIPLLVVS